MTNGMRRSPRKRTLAEEWLHFQTSSLQLNHGKTNERQVGFPSINVHLTAKSAKRGMTAYRRRFSFKIKNLEVIHLGF
jgi:hypothetical protein